MVTMIVDSYKILLNHKLFHALMYAASFVQVVVMCNLFGIDWQLAVAAIRDSINGIIIPFPTIKFNI